MKRADFILVTKTPDDASEDSIRRIRHEIKLRPQQQLYFTNIRYISVNAVQHELPAITISDLREYEVLAFSGIARPGNFIGFLKSKSRFVSHFRFPDHHNYTIKDIRQIIKKFSQLKGERKILLTTEKDWMRIVHEPVRKLLEGFPVYTLEIRVDFRDPKEKEIFDRKIRDYVEKNQPNRIFNRKQDSV